jgi:hypothetical protein
MVFRQEGGAVPELLYQIDSLVDASSYPEGQPNDHDPYVELGWYAMNRAQPIAPYETLIVGYENLDGPVKTDAERYMDGWLTREEVTALLPYICLELGHTVNVRCLPVPMKIFLDDGSSMATPAERALEDPAWRLALTLSPEDEGYPLPFAVGATYLVAPAFHSRLAEG